GYGWCSKGISKRAAGLGANVIVTEVDPVKAIEAVMDGFRVMPIADAAKIGDIFVTATGDINVIRKEHFIKMKDRAIIANSGHFNVELDIEGLKSVSKKISEVRDNVVEYLMKNGKRVFILAEGRLVNLSAAEGHPANVMDMSFANQSLAAEFILKNAKKLEKKVYKLPDTLDENIAALKLKTLGIKIDKLTPEQVAYLKSWELGT
ncbi:MAG: adenosylhomocysteinase, partial [bacterium]|nr:adenosylhomocysteinase [bacterium]